jgi:hypothetical protein
MHPGPAWKTRVCWFGWWPERLRPGNRAKASGKLDIPGCGRYEHLFSLLAGLLSHYSYCLEKRRHRGGVACIWRTSFSPLGGAGFGCVGRWCVIPFSPGLRFASFVSAPVIFLCSVVWNALGCLVGVGGTASWRVPTKRQCTKLMDSWHHIRTCSYIYREDEDGIPRGD